MFKTKGGGGVKGFLNNVQKKLQIWWRLAPLSFESLFLAEELEASTKKQEKKTKIPAGLGFALTSAINEMKTGKK